MLTKWLSKLSAKIFGEKPVNDYRIGSPTDSVLAVTTKEYVENPTPKKWTGAFDLSENTSYLSSIDKKGKPDRVPSFLTLPNTAGAYSSGPTPEESEALNELYNNSDNYGRLPTGHSYLFVNGEPVAVVKNMRVDDDSIYFDTWNRYGYRVNYEQDNE